MKKTIISLALLAAFAASAQDSASTSNSGSTSGAVSGANATGNINASQSDSASASRAAAGSVSGATGNTVIFNPSSAGATATGAGGIPTTRFINEQSGTSRNESVLSGGTVNRTTLDGTTTANQNVNATSRNINEGTTTANQNLSGGTTNRNVNTENINYSGTVDNKSSGGTYNVIESKVSGTTTVKMAPAIAMSGPASGPCTGNSGGIGLSGPGWGVGLNGSAVMDDCRMRENTRVLGMAMQSLDGQANPQEKGEVTVIFMDAVRALGQYNQSIYAAQKAK